MNGFSAWIRTPPPARPRGRAIRRDDGGFALFAALFVVVVVSGILLDSALRVQAEHAVASNLAAGVEARAAAGAGVQHALARLRELQRRTEAGIGDPAIVADRWTRVDDLAADLEGVSLPGGARYSVELRDAGAKLSVNDATADELRRLFLAVGAPYDEADVAAQSILDWRDPDGLHRPRGAEWDDHYRHLDRPVRPRNAPLPSVAELRDVRGVAGELFEAAARHLTVSTDGRVNLNSAPEPVLLALPGMGTEAARVVLESRASARPLRTLVDLEARLSPPARALLQRNFPDLAARALFEPHSVEITATGWAARGPIRRVIRARAVRSGPTVHLVRRLER